MKKQARPFPRYHVLVLIILTGVLGLLGIRLLTESEYGSLGTTDFIQYWSAASLLIDGKDPYNPELLQAVQQDLGRTQSEPLRMWNPPWLLVTLLPVLWFDFGLSTVLWLTINLAIILFSGSFIWRFFGGSTGAGMLVAWITSVSFFPFLLCWGVGQTSCLVLLGVVLFLQADRIGNPWLGAAGLILVSCKPQNVYLFCLVVAVSVLRERNWKLPAASFVLLSVAAGTLALLRPPWVADYLGALEQPPLYWATPTVGGILREYFSIQSSAVQYLPPLVTGGATLLLISRQAKIVWRSNISLILLVSSLSSPFGWSYDQVLLLFPCLESILRVLAPVQIAPGRRVLTILIVFGYSGSLFVFNLLGINEVHRFWLNLLPLLAFFLSGRSRETSLPKDHQESSQETTP